MAMLDRPEVGHLSFAVDLCDEKAIENLVNEIPVLNGVSNNAGITKLAPIQFISTDDFERIHRINLIAPVLLTKYLVKKKKIAKGGSIVFTASAGGVFVSSYGNAI